MKQATQNLSKPQTTPFKGKRPPLRKRVFSFLRRSKLSTGKPNTRAAASKAVEAAPGPPRSSWPDIEGLVPMTVLESSARCDTAAEAEQTLRFCSTVVGVFLLVLGVVVVITALARYGNFPFIHARTREPSRAPVTTHTSTAVHVLHEAAHSALPDKPARGSQVSGDGNETEIEDDSDNEKTEGRRLAATESPQETSADSTEQLFVQASPLENAQGPERPSPFY